MRTIKFIKVFQRVVRLLGHDANARTPQDAARAILDHINERIETIWNAWDWPEWTIVEERAFRQVWNDDHQYKKVSDLDGQPDEVYYIVTGKYYKVFSSAISNPPIGTVPTDEAYWTEITDAMYTYIAYDQTCRRSIGKVIGAYNSDPRMNCNSGLCFHPSAAGLDVRGTGNATVFVNYVMPMPVYTIIPYTIGATYNRSDTVFDPVSGECFQALETTTTDPSNTSSWRWIPFLEKWATYVVQGAFADCLSEFDQGGNNDIQAKMALASKAEDRATLALQSRIDELASQGQGVKWSFGRKCLFWRETVPFTGGSVSTLSSPCEDELGWVFPTPAPSPAPDPVQTNFTYLPLIMSLKTTDPNLINEQLTTSMSPGSIVMIYTGQMFRLDSGAADDDDPGEGNPCDYDATTNNVHWTEIQ